MGAKCSNQHFSDRLRCRVKRSDRDEPQVVTHKVANRYKGGRKHCAAGGNIEGTV